VKFKLDENFGTRTLEIFRAHGHDVHTVASQKLSGCTDLHLFHICQREQRCLVTLDLDFSDVTRFPPEASSGIVVVRVPRHPTPAVLEKLVQQFLAALGQTPLDRRLWIVETGRIRVHTSNETQ